jgi:hypothetical protein
VVVGVGVGCGLGVLRLVVGCPAPAAPWLLDFDVAGFALLRDAVVAGCGGGAGAGGAANSAALAGPALPSTRTLPFGPISRKAGLPAGTMPSCAAALPSAPGAALAATWFCSCCTCAATPASLAA